MKFRWNLFDLLVGMCLLFSVQIPPIQHLSDQSTMAATPVPISLDQTLRFSQAIDISDIGCNGFEDVTGLPVYYEGSGFIAIGHERDQLVVTALGDGNKQAIQAKLAIPNPPITTIVESTTFEKPITLEIRVCLNRLVYTLSK